MGFSISWIAFKDIRKPEALKRLQFRDTGHDDPLNQAPFSMADLRSGWALLYVNDFEFGTDEHLVGLSAEGTVVACQVEEHIMFSAAHFYTSGKEDWSVWHDSEHDGRYDVSTRGVAPPQLAAIVERLTALQDRNGGEKSMIDFLFNVPVELAAELTGYRHCQTLFAGHPLHFTAVERAR
jgi:hypothetical protein